MLEPTLSSNETCYLSGAHADFLYESAGIIAFMNIISLLIYVANYKFSVMVFNYFRILIARYKKIPSDNILVTFKERLSEASPNLKSQACTLNHTIALIYDQDVSSHSTFKSSLTQH